MRSPAESAINRAITGNKMKLYSFTYAEQEPHALFASISDHPYSLFFDSADTGHDLGRYSFIVYHPIEIIEAKNGVVSVTNPEQQLTFEAQPFEVVRDRLDIYGLDKGHRHDLPPFQGGAAGFFGYDLSRALENIPAENDDDPAMPDMAVGIYDRVFAWDHDKKTGWFITHAEDELKARAKFNHFTRLLQHEHAPRPVWKATAIGGHRIPMKNMSRRSSASLITFMPGTFSKLICLSALKRNCHRVLTRGTIT